jgi:hypothetical protein
MPLTFSIRKTARAGTLIVSAAAALYGSLGVLQAASMYQGSRALWNLNLWSALVFVAVLAACLTAWPRLVLSTPNSGVPTSTYFWLSVAALSLWPLIGHMLAVNACLDAGGSYDFVQGFCSTNESPPYIPTYRTHGLFMVIAGTCTGLAVLSYVTSKRTHTPRRSAA